MLNFFLRLLYRLNSIIEFKKYNKNKMSKVLLVDKEYKKIRKNVKKLTKEEEKKIDEFWNKYKFAYKNHKMVQRYYTKISGVFNEKYIPEGLMSYYLYRFYDNENYHEAFHNKNYYEKIFSDFKRTTVILRRINKLYYDDKYNLLSLNEAYNIISKFFMYNNDDLIFKPIPGGGGSGIKFLNKNIDKEKIIEILTNPLNKDFIIEKISKNHISFSVLNENSLNTLRIITFLYEGELSVIAIILRIGSPNERVDNFSKGGIACGVNFNGECMSYAFDRHGNCYTKCKNGFVLKNHKLLGVNKAIELAKKMHLRVPQFRQISWDIAIDEDENPFLIEFNTRGDIDIYQSIGVLPFGIKTEEILDEYLITLFFYKGANLKWNYKEYSDHIVLTSYEWDNKIIKVPEKIKNKLVTKIEHNCFKNEKIKKIIIPGSVKFFDRSICSKNVKAQIIKLKDTRNIKIKDVENITYNIFQRSIKIMWNNVENITHYYIFKSMNGKKKIFLKCLSSVCNNYVDFNVINGVVYEYFIVTYSSKYNCFGSFDKSIKLNF